MKIIVLLILLFLIAVTDFFTGGGGGDGKEIASFRVVCLGFSIPFSLCFLCCFVLEQRMVYEDWNLGFAYSDSRHPSPKQLG